MSEISVVNIHRIRTLWTNFGHPIFRIQFRSKPSTTKHAQDIPVRIGSSTKTTLTTATPGRILGLTAPAKKKRTAISVSVGVIRNLKICKINRKSIDVLSVESGTSVVDVANIQITDGTRRRNPTETRGNARKSATSRPSHRRPRSRGGRRRRPTEKCATGKHKYGFTDDESGRRRPTSARPQTHSTTPRRHPRRHNPAHDTTKVRARPRRRPNATTPRTATRKHT